MWPMAIVSSICKEVREGWTFSIYGFDTLICWFI